jgi:hypothetical protein
MRSIARVVRIGRNREFLPHREAHLKVYWYLSAVVSKTVDGLRSGEGGIVAHGSKESFALIVVLAILGQTLPGERAFGVPPLVDLALPAFIGPTGSAEAD